MTNPSILLTQAIAWILGCAIMLLLSACSATRAPDLTAATVLNIANTEDLAALPSLEEGGRLEKPVIIKIPRGFSLPVHIVVDTPLAAMESHCSQMVFKEDLFLALSNEAMLASPDLKTWANAAEMEAVKELFGGGKGEISVSMGADKQQGAQLDLKIAVQAKAE